MEHFPCDKGVVHLHATHYNIVLLSKKKVSSFSGENWIRKTRSMKILICKYIDLKILLF